MEKMNDFIQRMAAQGIVIRPGRLTDADREELDRDKRADWRRDARNAGDFLNWRQRMMARRGLT
jgi:hypothetical protein